MNISLLSLGRLRVLSPTLPEHKVAAPHFFAVFLTSYSVIVIFQILSLLLYTCRLVDILLATCDLHHCCHWVGFANSSRAQSGGSSFFRGISHLALCHRDISDSLV